MKTISILNPAMCCNTGRCGTEVDQALVSFSADCDWLKQKALPQHVRRLCCSKYALRMK